MRRTVSCISSQVLCDFIQCIPLHTVVLWLHNVWLYPYTANGFCDYDQLTLISYGDYQWVELAAGNTTDSPCFFGPDGELATRYCNISAVWEEPMFDDCDESELFTLLHMIIVIGFKKRAHFEHNINCS